MNHQASDDRPRRWRHDADPAIVAESCSPAAAAPVLQQPRRLLSVTGSTLAWAQRAAASSAAAPGVSLLAAATSAVVAATEGVTASFIKELVRRATLVVLRAGQRPAVLRQAHFDEVLAEMNAEHQSLTPVAARRRRRPGDARSLGTTRRTRR